MSIGHGLTVRQYKKQYKKSITEKWSDRLKVLFKNKKEYRAWIRHTTSEHMKNMKDT